MVLLGGVYYGAMYGGSTTSILMRIPGEAASVMTCIDGYAMTQNGRAGAALAIAAIGSFVAGTFGVVGLMLLAPTLASFALRFGPAEYTALLLMGFFILAYMSGGSMLKTLAMAAFGLLLGMIGIDTMTGTRASASASSSSATGWASCLSPWASSDLRDPAYGGASQGPAVRTPKFRELMPSRTELRDSAGRSRAEAARVLIGIIPDPPT